MAEAKTGRDNEKIIAPIRIVIVRPPTTEPEVCGACNPDPARIRYRGPPRLYIRSEFYLDQNHHTLFATHKINLARPGFLPDGQYRIAFQAQYERGKEFGAATTGFSAFAIRPRHALAPCFLLKFDRQRIELPLWLVEHSGGIIRCALRAKPFQPVRYIDGNILLARIGLFIPGERDQ